MDNSFMNLPGTSKNVSTTREIESVNSSDNNEKNDNWNEIAKQIIEKSKGRIDSVNLFYLNINNILKIRDVTISSGSGSLDRQPLDRHTLDRHT